MWGGGGVRAYKRDHNGNASPESGCVRRGLRMAALPSTGAGEIPLPISRPRNHPATPAVLTEREGGSMNKWLQILPVF